MLQTGEMAADFTLPSTAGSLTLSREWRDGKVVLANRFTEFTGRPPAILPGMTPTTVDARIVSAGANAGFFSELAGGGLANLLVAAGETLGH